MTVNEISNPNNNSEDNRVELATYDKLRHRFRYHWEEGRKQAREANECINGMVLILHEQNPEWSINKIASKIAIDNEDLEGFSRATIYNNLDEENRQLIDTRFQKHTKSKDLALDPKVLEDSSVSKKELITTIKKLQQDVQKRDIMLIDLQQEINSKSREEPKPQTEELQDPDIGNSKNNFDTSQDELDREEEWRPVKSWTLSEYEEEHPKIAESPWEVIGEINRSIARLWTALTKQKNMPTREDDVKKDYIIPARTRLQDMANGSSKTERIYLFNWLTWIIAAAKDARDIVEKADATAYDTRED